MIFWGTKRKNAVDTEKMVRLGTRLVMIVSLDIYLVSLLSIFLSPFTAVIDAIEVVGEKNLLVSNETRYSVAGLGSQLRRLGP